MPPSEHSDNGHDSTAQMVAAVDLGSNSFHMVVGTTVHGELSILDRLREPVRLAAGLNRRGVLDDETVERALQCLERFGQRLKDVPRPNIRVVGTNTLRRAKAGESGHFLSRARRVLGVPIEVLPGYEEGRLIYLGVAHALADDEGRRLVVDIGGGSTECVLGQRFEPQIIDSMHMGCVAYSRRFFPDGELSREAFKRAETAARLELSTIQEQYRSAAWDDCIGSSGTIKAVAQILSENQWSESGITLAGVRKLKKAMIAQRSAKKLSLVGMQSDRAPVLAGGVAVLKAVLQSLKIESMRVSRAALREGILWDMLGRIAHEDVRDRTIVALSRRYHIDEEQARRVEKTAVLFARELTDDWNLDPEASLQHLSWAARLHEIGLSLSYVGLHKHGQYLIEHSNMPGFSREDRHLLATLVRGHRRKLDPTIFEDLPPYHRDSARYLCAILRLAVRLNRGRSSVSLPEIHVHAEGEELELEFPEGWLDEHPLTRADLEVEGDQLKPAGFRLTHR